MLHRSALAIGVLTVLLFGIGRADEEGATQGLIVNGAVATALGGVALIIGGVMYGEARSTWNQPSGCLGGCTDGNIVAESAGLGLIAVGAAHLSIGIPLLAVGGYRRAHPKKVQVSAAVAPTRGGAAGSLTIRW
ncbi:MAG: hypothetical protein ABI321_13530 [Polyangia bacterium]